MNKSTKLHINNLANRYLKKEDDLVFSSLYKTLASEMSLKLDKWERTTELAEQHDVITCFDDAILDTLKKLRKDGGGDFVKLFTTIVHINYKKLLKEVISRREHWHKDEKDSEELTIDLMQDEEAGDDITQRKSKKDADKRELISELLDNEDSLTTGIANVILSVDSTKIPSNREIARSVECDHKTVKSRLDKLKTKYSSEIFGDVNSYLAV